MRIVNPERKFIQLTLLSVLLVLVSGYMSFFGIFFLFISVVPQLLLLCAGRYALAAVSWLAVFSAAVMLRGAGFAALYILIFVPYALWFRNVLGIKMSPYSRIVNAALMWVFIFLVLGAAGYLLTGFNILAETVRSAKIAAGLSIGWYYDFGIPQQQIDIIENSVKSFIVFFRNSFFGWSMITGFLGSWMVYHGAAGSGFTEPLPPVKKIRLPEQYIWFLIAAIALYLAGTRWPGQKLLTLMGSNMGMVLLVGYFLSGIGLAVTVMMNLNISHFMRLIVLLFMLFFAYGIYVFILLGIVDVWVDFRRRWSFKDRKEI
ncbi:MAG: DUF2232 domain-containing protein [Elusimicrobia bacterium]|nr:DUF2232 domain-containing protein [Elusimicrobiota bacterium]